MAGPCEHPVASSSSFDPAAFTQTRFAGYGQSRLPGPRDLEVQRFIDELRGCGTSSVDEALMTVSEMGRRVLRAYAERMASLAVRTTDPEQLERALVAIVIGGLDENAYDALMVMPLIEDSARRIGAELHGLLEDAGKIVGERGTVNLVRWLERSPEDRSLAAMGFVKGADEDGFRYEFES